MCVSPIALTREIAGRKVMQHVPCGVCPECIKDNQNSYVIRTVEEFYKRCKPGTSLWFITLTYSNETVPVAFDSDGEIVEPDVVPLLKRPDKYRPKSFAVQNPLSENYGFDSEENPDDMPKDVYEGNEDMPLEVFYGLPERKVKFSVDEVKAEIESERKVVEESDVVDVETGETPCNVYSLDTRDLQLWKKRCRRKIDYHHHRRVDFGYLLCGEYGPRTHRPHYHGLLVGLSDEDMQVFKKDWESHYGFTCFKKISYYDVEKTSRYVSKYITKQKCLEDSNVVKGLVEKPRKIVSRGYGSQTAKREQSLRFDVMGELSSLSGVELDRLEHINPLKLDKLVERLSLSLKYKLNGKEYKLPRYYRLKLFYVKDALTGRYRPTALSNLVSKAVQSRIQKDFVRKCIELASNESLPESYETYAKVAKIVCDTERLERQDRAKAIIQTNIAAFRKSRF